MPKDIAVGMTMTDGVYGGKEIRTQGGHVTPHAWIKGFKTMLKVTDFKPAMAGIQTVPGAMRD